MSMYKPNFSRFDSLIDIMQHFNTKEKCVRFIKETRWGDDIVCPYCGHHHCYERTDGNFKCPACNHNFSVLVGTIFENTKLPLVKWFMAMYLISCHKKGISSMQLSVDIKISQKSAWYMLQKIRTLFVQDDTESLSGDVECDEMYFGGREKNKHESRRVQGTQGRSLKTKTAIFGMAERNGNVVAMKVPDTTSATLIPIIEQFVERGSNIHTDELNSYCCIGMGYAHHVVRHKMKEFSVGNVTTNTIEGFWGHFKRMAFGTYHYISSKYLQRYIDESVYRWNTQLCSESERFIFMLSNAMQKCDYNQVRNIA